MSNIDYDDRPFAILGVDKLHTNAEIAAMSAHWLRTRVTLNADKRRTHLNKCIVGSVNPYQRFKEIIEEKQITKFRKNGVRLIEMVLTFSPKYLKDDKTGRYRNDAKQRLKNWEVATAQWLKATFGDRCVSAYIHYDEKNIHAHAALIPLERKTRKSGKKEWTLNARGITGGSKKLKQLHDSYADALQHLGLRRGVRNSGAKHVSLKKFYGAIEESKAAFERMGYETPDTSPQRLKTWRQNMSTIIAALRRDESQEIERLEKLIDELEETNLRLQNQLKENNPDMAVLRY